jgi:hypothetical protein
MIANEAKALGTGATSGVRKQGDCKYERPVGRHLRTPWHPQLPTLAKQAEVIMPSIEDNKAIVGRWFTEFWGKTCNLGVIDALAAPDMLLQYSLHAPRRGHADIKAFMSEFLGHRGPDCRGRLCRRPLGRWRHAHRSRFRRLPRRLVAGSNRQNDAVYRDDSSACSERQNHRGDRSGRWSDRASATRSVARRLTAEKPLPASIGSGLPLRPSGSPRRR